MMAMMSINPYIAIPLATWLIAQLIKFFLAVWHNHFDLRYLYASGGMPSAHSAVVSALAVTALVRSGVESPIFGLAAIFAAIVMYDSFGVRRAAGEQAAAINAILDSLSRQIAQPRLREILGHKPAEVSVGALLGIGLGLLFNASYLSAQVNWLVSLPGKSESLIYLATGLVILVGGFFFGIWLSHKYRSSRSIGRLSKNLIIKDVTVGLLLSLISFAAYERALYLGWRLWVYLLFSILVIWALVLFMVHWPGLPAELAKEREEARLGQWLPRKRQRARKG
jgi:acid phosphatase family membrane protein YuiD